MTAMSSFIYENLKFISAFGNGTSLCIYEPTRKLYIVKKIDVDCVSYYEKIASINSPRLSKIFHISKSDNTASIVMEYISGDCLSDILQRNKTLSEEEAIKITSQICKGLSALHKIGLVHRDINPNNIIITTDGNATIIDYGIVRSFRQAKSADTVILGTPGYAAPEQFGFSQSDERTDIYAMGVLLNVMLTGKLPNEQLAQGRLGSIIEKCIKIDSKQRYHNVDELSNAIRAQKTEKADLWLSKIPGFRSKHWFVVTLSVIGYPILALFSAGLFAAVKPGIPYYIGAAFAWFFIFAIPFFCFHNFLNIWDRLPFTKGAGLRTQKIIYRTLGFSSVLLGLTILGSIPMT